MKILILGATGFIGSAILQRLASDGHEITGLGRAPEKARLKWPVARWIKADLARLTATDWQPLVDKHDVILNCAGALQDGLSDDLVATQQEAMLTLYAAAKSLGGRLVVQISARTDGAAGSQAFLRTKRQADDALVASGLPFVILRPALVIGRNAHGGTALLRSLASFPFVLPLVHAESPVATVSMNDVAEAVSRAVNGSILPRSDLDLAAEETPSLAELVRLHRAWLGLAPAPVVTLPAALAKPVTWGADLAGKLGWRSPLRSTAIAVMSEGVLGKRRGPEGFEPAGAAATLTECPSGVQDLWFARLYLLKPVMILTLSLFWLLSGLVPLVDPGAAAAHFSAFLPASAAMAVTLATCLVDILLGITVIVRPMARRALLGMMAVSVIYLAGGTLFEGQLWLDPLGPLVKVLPSLVLTLIALATLDER
ncbi:SDR family oxidoreductase [Rhizobium sp. XQZ8]|uniref:SDR family oxidoreductase n=1 Tax=Rhizobium populisoli TaxID=2859785 RepID=UPI001C677193|nr:SDR family oxidoreductase [Rhizobium populisoli]MBW6422640.1 SDR family oxidoreductase [Rhizobium populisoli]